MMAMSMSLMVQKSSLPMATFVTWPLWYVKQATMKKVQQTYH